MTAKTRNWITDGFSLGNLINLGTIILACAGFYFTTISGLREHEGAIIELKATIAEQKLQLRGLEVTERTARDDVRKDLSGKLERVADGVSLLNVKAAATEAQLNALTRELTRVGNQLETAIRGKTQIR